MADFNLRPVTSADREWIAAFAAEHWGSDQMVTRGLVLLISEQLGFVAEQNDQVIGLVTYHIAGGECEVTSLDSLREGIGLGTALLEAVRQAARENNCRRLFLITTNDNLHALRFYQKRGFVLAALHPGAVIEARKLKPEIPLTGYEGIPIRDEIELEIQLE